MNKRFLDIDHVQWEPEEKGGGWIVSYADMMTIILTFFILLLSISTIAQTKYELLVQAFTGERKGNLTEVKEQIDRIIEEQQLGGEISTMLDKDGLKIEFSNALLFNSGEAQLKETAKPVFEPIRMHLIEGLNSEYGLVIEGYTDDVPIQNARFDSNWALSTSRAIHVMELLTVEGMDSRRVSVKGYANTRPATEVDISDEAALARLPADELEEVRAANRRVIVRVDRLDDAVLKRIAPDGASKKRSTPSPDGADGTPGEKLKPFELPKVGSQANKNSGPSKDGQEP
ncbi:MAG: flagellar motor protein MotB [Myxococcota bacterium]